MEKNLKINKRAYPSIRDLKVFKNSYRSVGVLGLRNVNRVGTNCMF